jgi:hypothetical protein
MPLEQDLTIAAPHRDRSARIDLQLRIGALFIADRQRMIALAERAGRDTKRDRELLAHLESGRQNLIEARQRLSVDRDISAQPLLAA